MRPTYIRTCYGVFFSLLSLIAIPTLHAAPVVPGTGVKLPQVGDDFEDPNWGFIHNMPKSSDEIDDQKRFPTGKSTNGRWYEGIKRGQPDLLKVVPTPEGGLPGSDLSLLLRTRQSGIPGSLSRKMEQDDFIVNCHYRLGGALPIAQTPSCVVRVFMPPIADWENRTGATFGFRAALTTHTWKVPEDPPKRLFFRSNPKPEYLEETYWPGMFVMLQSETDQGREYDSAYFAIRGNTRGHEVRGPQITETGWWTLGMSFTPDGQVHYYIRKGIEDLTAEDYVTSQFPYGFKAEHFKTFFFNVCNRDDGRTWSTPWVIDDPTLYHLPRGSRHLARKGK